MANQSAKNGGIGFLGLLALMFIYLKLTHVIYWSWWWVTLPIWAIPGILITIFVIFFLLKTIVFLAQYSSGKNREDSLKKKHQEWIVKNKNKV